MTLLSSVSLIKDYRIIERVQLPSIIWVPHHLYSFTGPASGISGGPAKDPTSDRGARPAQKHSRQPEQTSRIQEG